MYHLISGFYAEWTKKARYNVLIVGLSGVGKSCAIEKIKSIYLKRPPLPPTKIAPTVGQNVFDLALPKLHLHFWDLGGSPSVRTLWAKYYEESHAVVWVVDARDFVGLTDTASDNGKGKGKLVDRDAGSDAAERREESWRILADLLVHPSLEGQPILILANKCDACSSDPDMALGEAERKALTSKIQRWFHQKLAQIGDENTGTSTNHVKESKLPSNIFADDEGDGGDLGTSAQRPMHGFPSSTRDYDWDVIATSAIDGTGMHDAIDWLSIRVQTLNKH
ncbi:P-loop containing nucleoside triphosphate hydrolase protein [Testicularia cyperi]|uniref:P-loop containing nucleoside triphosphate hydrolase protein n=1 Tax=Testicularia cyperi TaxID=1882483 RepID=A0A317XI50_9BASI|nr:P-loop containing nucleoside triphosphate hydrolase protein [Testicularia cyperi]